MDLKTIGVFLALCVPFFLMTVWAVVHAAEREFGPLGRKVMWLVVASVPFVGFIFYFLIGARKGKKPDRAASVSAGVGPKSH